MGKEVSYYSFAENDYLYLKDSIAEGWVSNAMCSSAQNICERFLKAIVEKEALKHEDTSIMKTHSLKRLRKFIEEFVTDFECDWGKVILADGFYFSARYPGEDSYFVDKSDVDDCWEAVCETKRAVDAYIYMQRQKQQSNEDSFRLMDTNESSEYFRRGMKR